MKTKLLLTITALLTVLSLRAQTDERYIEVTGTAEIEIVPDKIHYIIEIREYFEEEFDGKSKPEEYRTKVPLAKIEQELRQDLAKAGITQEAIRTQEVGDYWRQQGHDFLVSKRFDLTLHDFGQIDSILHFIDTRGVNTMHVGELENKDILTYHRQGKIAALKAARQKAAYLAEALGKKAGDVIRIVEQQDNGRTLTTQSNVTSAATGSYDSFRTIKKQYSMLVRFAITD